MFLKKNATFFITILFSSFLLPELRKKFLTDFLGKFIFLFGFYFLNSTKKCYLCKKISEKLNSKNYKKC